MQDKPQTDTQDKPQTDDMASDAHTELRRQTSEGDAGQSVEPTETEAPEVGLDPPILQPRTRHDPLADDDGNADEDGNGDENEDRHDRDLDDLFNDMPV